MHIPEIPRSGSGSFEPNPIRTQAASGFEMCMDLPPPPPPHDGDAGQCSVGDRFAAVPAVSAKSGEARRGEREQSGMVCYTKEGQPDSPTARQPDSPTARQPDIIR